MKAHVIQNGIVANTIEVDSLDFMPNLIPATEGGIGWSWDGTTLSPPAPTPDPVPQYVTMRQARLALLGAGLLDQVDAAIAAMTGPEGKAAQIEWEYASEVQRNSALVAGMGAALGMGDAALDALFVAAGRIV